VVIERPSFNVRDYLWSGTVGLISAAGQLRWWPSSPFSRSVRATLSAASWSRSPGPACRRKDHRARAGRHHEAHRTLSARADPHQRDGGRRDSLAFWAIGLENAAVWGILAAVTNLIPYIGSVIVMAAAGLVAFLQFNSIEMALLVGGASLVIHTFVGNLLVPFSRAERAG
jgi:hypothetical protein